MSTFQAEEFHEKVYAITRLIPQGKVTSYGKRLRPAVLGLLDSFLKLDHPRIPFSSQVISLGWQAILLMLGW